MTDVWPWLLAGWLVMAAAMSGVWVLQRRSGDAGVVDVAWTFGVGLLGAAYALFGGEGLRERRWLVAALIAIWSTRLGAHIFRRVMTQPEDGRYQQLKKHWGPTSQRRLFQFFQLQALAAVLFAAPLLFTAANPQPLSWLDAMGLTIWAISIAGESLADRQLTQFRMQADNRGKVCQRGLWRYSRHPNYFFEWLHWWAYVAFAYAAPWGWLTIAWPLLMLYFLLRVTGIPPTEEQALRSRGDAYRRYQRTTSAFVPWFTRKIDG